MADKKIQFPKDEQYLAIHYLGNHFKKGAELPKISGTYVFDINGSFGCSETYYYEKPQYLNKKFYNDLKCGFFDKYIDVDIYFLRHHVPIVENTKFPGTLEFTIEEDGIGVTHTLKVRNTVAFELKLSYWPKRVPSAFFRFVQEKEKKVVEREELRQILFEIAKRATKTVYGKLPWGQYHIDNELEYLDAEEKARADEWFKIVNEELDSKYGYKFTIDWKK